MSRRRIIVSLATSADGYIARGDGSVDWLDRPKPADFYGMSEFMKSIDTILLGRKTWEQSLSFTKGKKKRPTSTLQIKSYVFSRNPQLQSDDEYEFVKEPIKEFATRLRAGPGKDIWMMGGGEIIRSFLEEGELDEFIIHVVPVFIGEGIPLIAPARLTVELKLLATRKYEDGVVKLHYSCNS